MSELICDSCGRTVSDAEVSNYGCAVFGKAWCGGTMRERKPAPKPQHLSIEECVYWLVVIGWLRHAQCVVERDAEQVESSLAFCSARARKKALRPEDRRKHGVLAFLCGEALRALGADQ